MQNKTYEFRDVHYTFRRVVNQSRGITILLILVYNYSWNSYRFKKMSVAGLRSSIDHQFD